MYHILIAFPDPSQSFTMGAFTSHAAAQAYANYYRPYARQLFSIPCIVAVQAAL